jgi:hypothetical protein
VRGGIWQIPGTHDGEPLTRARRDCTDEIDAWRKFTNVIGAALRDFHVRVDVVAVEAPEGCRRPLQNSFNSTACDWPTKPGMLKAVRQWTGTVSLLTSCVEPGSAKKCWIMPARTGSSSKWWGCNWSTMAHPPAAAAPCSAPQAHGPCPGHDAPSALSGGDTGPYGPIWDGWRGGSAPHFGPHEPNWQVGTDGPGRNPVLTCGDRGGRERS